MILKKIDDKEISGTYQKYGHEAEKQMAFYLKRAFQDSKDVHVINDLRLEMNDDVAQIDHLVVHRFGFVIIESKSVTAQVSVNEHGEWARHYAKSVKGMPSPVKQARRQADFLQKFLTGKEAEIFRKKLVFKAAMSDYKFDILVAISDHGIIKRSGNVQFSEVHKADQIIDAIEALQSGYHSENKKVLSLKLNYEFADYSMVNIVRCLVESHKPRKAEPAALSVNKPRKNPEKQEIAKQSESTSVGSFLGACSKCSSENVEITYGKYGYYFKCRDCTGNTSIKLSCKESACKPKIQKRKNHFYKVCASCETSALYFVNQPVEEAAAD